jgi:hypothetical protein
VSTVSSYNPAILQGLYAQRNRVQQLITAELLRRQEIWNAEKIARAEEHKLRLAATVKRLQLVGKERVSQKRTDWYAIFDMSTSGLTVPQLEELVVQLRTRLYGGT